jgi:uncharacterized protein (TIGR02996 family)
MHDEDGFLAAIRLEPADDTDRLVFADWLDEQDDCALHQKAAFVRLELRLATDPAADSLSLTTRLQLLAARLDPNWLAVVSRPPIQGCTSRLDRECPAVWSRLTPTQDPCARTCLECRSTVRYARTRDELLEYSRRGYRTAVTVVLAGVEGAHALGRWCPMGAAVTQEPLIDRPRLPRLRDERCPDRQQLIEMLADDPDPAGPDARPTKGGRVPPRNRREKGRHRNIQREDWEEME